MIKYLVEWLDRGYYAAKQPTYQWSFTKNIDEAASYKSEKTAKARACGDRFGSGHGMKPYRIVKVDGNHVILEDPGSFIIPSVQQALKKREQGPDITLASLMGNK